MTSSYDLSVLLGRVEGATGPDRELDLAIGLALAGWEVGPDGDFGGEYLHAGHVSYAWPTSPGAGYECFTESLDAALALTARVLPGWCWHMSQGVRVQAGLWSPDGAAKNKGYAVHRTPALALLAALLRALIAQHRRAKSRFAAATEAHNHFGKED